MHLERAAAFSLPFSWLQHCVSRVELHPKSDCDRSRRDQISELHWRQLGHFAAFQLAGRRTGTLSAAFRKTPLNRFVGIDLNSFGGPEPAIYRCLRTRVTELASQNPRWLLTSPPGCAGTAASRTLSINDTHEQLYSEKSSPECTCNCGTVCGYVLLPYDPSITRPC